MGRRISLFQLFSTGLLTLDKTHSVSGLQLPHLQTEGMVYMASDVPSDYNLRFDSVGEFGFHRCIKNFLTLPHLCGNYNRHFYDSYPDLGLSLVSQVVYCTTSGGTIHIDYKMNGTPPPPSYATLLPCLKYAIYILCGQRADSCCQIFFNITCWNSANFFLQNPFQALIRMKLTSSLKGNHPHSDGFCSESKEEKIRIGAPKLFGCPFADGELFE